MRAGTVEHVRELCRLLSSDADDLAELSPDEAERIKSLVGGITDVLDGRTVDREEWAYRHRECGPDCCVTGDRCEDDREAEQRSEASSAGGAYERCGASILDSAQRCLLPLEHVGAHNSGGTAWRDPGVRSDASILREVIADKDRAITDLEVKLSQRETALAMCADMTEQRQRAREREEFRLRTMIADLEAKNERALEAESEMADQLHSAINSAPPSGLDDYQREAMRTAPRDNYPEGFDRLIFDRLIWSLGLAGEAGEVADLVKKIHGHSHPLDRAKVCKELGDVLWYLATVAHSFGFKLSEVGAANVAKLRERFPNGFTSAASQARVDEVSR